MKKFFTLILMIDAFVCNAQSSIKTLNTLSEITHVTAQRNDIYKLNDKLYGGGILIASDKKNYVVDTGIIFPTNDPAIVLVRKMVDAATVNLAWYGVNDSVHNFMPSFNKATKYLEATNHGGAIIFPAGTFLADPYFTIDANNITVKGAGMNKTFIKVPAASNSGLMVNSHYRDAGWLTKAEDLITYNEDGLSTGSGYINLKIKPDKNKLSPGTIIFINAGANYYDQNYGEFNMVDHCDNSGRVFLKYKLSRNYTQAVSSWTSTLTSDFTPPAEGNTGTIYFSGTQPRAGIPISIDNDLYTVVSSTTNSAVVFNPKNKGNSNKIVKAGTHLFRYRAIALTPSVVYNVSVQDMTITGRRKAITVSNTFKTSFKNVRFNWLPSTNSNGGIWLDGDDGRDFTMANCEINCAYLFSAQFARSFADIYISNTKFNQAAIQFTEFNINANVTNCEFYLANHNLPGEINSSAILLGNTCNSINFNNNTIHASNLNNVFYSGEIQGSKALISSVINVNHNTIICDNVGTLFSGAYPGNVYVLNNNISGSANFLFSLHAVASYNNSKPVCLVKDNNFSGNIDGFGAASTNVQYVHNTIKRAGAANASNELNVWGNVLYNHVPKDTAVINFVCKDNIFINWNLRPNSFSHYFPLTEKTEISNNHFYSGQKDSVISLKK